MGDAQTLEWETYGCDMDESPGYPETETELRVVATTNHATVAWPMTNEGKDGYLVGRLSERRRNT